MIMTRGKDDNEILYNLLGTKEYRKTLDAEFKNEKSNFKIAVIVDMWLTGFDVPFLDTMYIDKPIKQHNLIQTISRVNRKFEGKNKGLVVDYIGIKKQMNLALKQYSEGDKDNFEEKAFYDILKELCIKYDFTYPEDKLIELAKAVKELVEGQAKFPDWNKRDDIKSALKVGLILLLDEFGYPPVERDEVYFEIFEQAENFKKNQN
jgi:type I site-specific restriction-modification system R (restriction) subunit